MKVWGQLILDEGEVRQALKDYLDKRNIEVDIEKIRPCSNAAFIDIPVEIKKKR